MAKERFKEAIGALFFIESYRRYGSLCQHVTLFKKRFMVAGVTLTLWQLIGRKGHFTCVQHYDRQFNISCQRRIFSSYHHFTLLGVEFAHKRYQACTPFALEL